MNNDNKIIPQYRFPEFKDDGSWDNLKVEEIITNESSSLSINKLEILDSGYKLFGADGLVGYIDSYKQEEDYIGIVKDGSGAGRLSYYPSYSSVVGTLTYLKIKDKKLNDLKFQYYNLHNIDFKNHIKGGGIPHIYYSDYKNDFIGNPPSITEQQKIAACLSSLDDVIAGHAEKLTALEEHKKGLMQNLFPQEGETQPKYRFPEFENDGDWLENVLDDVFNFVRGPFGGALKKDIFVKEGYAVYEQSHAIYSDFSEFRYYINSDKYKELIRFSVKPNDLIMSCSGTMGKFALVPENCSEGVINQALLKLSAKKGYSILYLKYLMETDLYQNKLLSQSAGGAIKNVVGVSEIKLIKIYLPKTLVEQQKIASVLSSVDELIVAQREKIEALKEHKKGLMQGLFPKIES